MLISYQKNFLFVHIPKTAGTSVIHALSPHADDAMDFWENRLLARLGVNVKHVGPYRRKRFRGHSQLRVIQKHIPRTVYDGLFRFAFVRNPWDALGSLYHYIPSRPTHRYSSYVAGLSFSEFVDIWTLRAECQQKSFVVNAQGDVDLDFIGRFENLADDFNAICKQLGIVARLGHANPSTHRDYRPLYTDETAELVATRLADDISEFGYSFDGLNT